MTDDNDPNRELEQLASFFVQPDGSATVDADPNRHPTLRAAGLVTLGLIAVARSLDGLGASVTSAMDKDRWLKGGR